MKKTTMTIGRFRLDVVDFNGRAVHGRRGHHLAPRLPYKETAHRLIPR
jgi:hypothetical protein